MLTVDQYARAWERKGATAPRLNSRLIPGASVLETLSMVVSPSMRYAFVDDFGYAVSYCLDRLRHDLTPPDEQEDADSVERWWRMRSAFTSAELAAFWVAAEKGLTDVLQSFVLDGYSRSLGDRLREVVNAYGLDLELGEIYVIPQDLPALLARLGNPLVWWDDDIERLPELEQQPFNFADMRHRTILARRLREENVSA